LTDRSPSLLARIALLPVRAYQRVISPLIAPRCRYYPTCSSYAVEAVQTYGVFRGSVLAAWRLLRCNPFSEGGFDHVADQKLFKQHDCAKDHKHHGAGA
jgi:putative membrane protein insertion efficiency factor